MLCHTTSSPSSWIDMARRSGKSALMRTLVSRPAEDEVLLPPALPLLLGVLSYKVSSTFASRRHWVTIWLKYSILEGTLLG